MKKLITLSLASTMILGGLTTVFADETVGEEEGTGSAWVGKTTGSEDGKGATSEGHVKLTPADEDGKPVDPIDPPEEGGEEGGGETGNVGPLTIDYVSPLEFGEHKLEGAATVYSSTTTKPNVQVTDNRGEGQGWTLQVTSSAFTDLKDKTKVLKGAVLELPVGTVKTTEGNVSEAPTVKAVSLNTDTPTTETLMTAQAKAGMGTWADTFNAEEITIKVPGGNFIGEYVSTLTWSLLDAPQG